MNKFDKFTCMLMMPYPFIMISTATVTTITFSLQIFLDFVPEHEFWLKETMYST